MVRPPPLCLAVLLLAACGDQGDDAVARANSVEELTNRLDKLSDRTSEDIEPPARLGDLRPEDVGPWPRPGSVCRLARNRRLILLVDSAGAVARIDGRRVTLAVAGPVGPTGGFFTAPGVTVSVGRTKPLVPGAESAAGAWPARLSVGGDPERPIEKYEATWACTR